MRKETKQIKFKKGDASQMKHRLIIFSAFCAIAILLVGCCTLSACFRSSPTKEIVISYSSRTTDQIAGWIKADPGYTYLIVNLDIENNGYNSFSTNPSNFSAIVNNVGYDVAGGTLRLENRLKEVDLLNGGRISGEIAFKLPKGVVTTGYQLRYKPSHWGKHNIRWIKQ